MRSAAAPRLPTPACLPTPGRRPTPVVPALIPMTTAAAAAPDPGRRPRASRSRCCWSACGCGALREELDHPADHPLHLGPVRRVQRPGQIERALLQHRALVRERLEPVEAVVVAGA